MHDYFSAGAAEQFQFFRIPKALIHNEEFRSVSIDAKLLYGLLLDRMSLSERNNWRDDPGRVFIIYTVKAVGEDLGCCQEKACKLMAELETVGLIERRRLSGQLGKEQRRQLLRLTDQQNAYCEQTAMDAFASGFRLAMEIARELRQTD